MRHSFGKPNDLVARVRIGQPIISIRAKDDKKQVVIEALRRAKMKFPGASEDCGVEEVGFHEVDS